MNKQSKFPRNNCRCHDKKAGKDLNRRYPPQEEKKYAPCHHQQTTVMRRIEESRKNNLKRLVDSFALIRPIVSCPVRVSEYNNNIVVTPKTNNTQIRRVKSETSVAEGNSKKERKVSVCVNLRVFPSSHTETLPFSDSFLLFVCQFVALIRNLRTRLFKSLLSRATKAAKNHPRRMICRLDTRKKAVKNKSTQVYSGIDSTNKFDKWFFFLLSAGDI